MTDEVFCGNRKGHINPGGLGNLLNIRTFKVKTEIFQIPAI